MSRIIDVFCVGITGGIGSGKSTAVNLFKLHHVGIIDADLLARKLVEPDQPAYKQIVAHFSTAILDEKKNLDRRKIRDIIFKIPAERQWLESLLHPLIHQEIKEQCNKIKTLYILIDIPLLTNRQDFSYLNRILVMDCPKAIQISRIVQRDRISEQTAQQIIKTQISREQRNALADDIILNDSNNLATLEKQVEKLHRYYSSLSKKMSNERPNKKPTI